MRRVVLPLHIDDSAPPEGSVLREYAGLSMGTSWSVRLAAPAQALAGELQAGLQAQLDAVVAQMSHWEADSHLSRFNRAAAGSWHVLPAAFYDVLAFALEVARLSGGAYDPCGGALVNLWGFGPHGRFGAADFVPPTPAAVAQALAQRGAAAVLLEPAQRRAWQPGGVQLDFSAVAKGYAVDRLAFYLKSQGVQHFLVEVGGELRGAGVKPDGQPWWVQLEQVADGPSAAAAPQELVLALHGLAVATSGDYRRYFRHGAQRYPHTIDPRRGVPIDNGLASVTVVHPHCMAADAWSTALTVLGVRDGLALAERLGLAARFVERSGEGLREYLSTPFQHMLAE